MKLISKKFIRELSKIVDCSICYQCMQDPTECVKCQNIWCSSCIQKNENKCPNKCIDTQFTKPHRIFRQIMSEVLVECNKCKIKVKQIDYENHISDNQCHKESLKRSFQKAINVVPAPKLKKIIKREFNQQIQTTQNMVDRYEEQEEEEQNIDNSINNIFDDDNDTKSQFNQNMNHLNTEFDLNDIFQDDATSDNQQNTQPLFEVKEERFNRSRMESSSSITHHLQDTYSNFKQMNIQLFQGGRWTPLEEGMNNELNFCVIKRIQENESLSDLVVQIRNTVFDFSKLESYDSFVSLRVLDNEEDSETDDEDKKYYAEGRQQKKNKVKFTIYNNQVDLIKHVNLYFLNDTDRIDYDNSDRERVLQQFLEYPLSTHVQTKRSKIDFKSMQEYNGMKKRDIKFELQF